MPKQSSVMKLYNGGVPNSATAVYISPASTQSLISNIVFHNSSGSTVTVQAWLVPTTLSTAYQYKFINEDILTNDTYVFANSPMMMEALDQLFVVASTATAVSIFVNGSQVILV